MAERHSHHAQAAPVHDRSEVRNDPRHARDAVVGLAGCGGGGGRLAAALAVVPVRVAPRAAMRDGAVGAPDHGREAAGAEHVEDVAHAQEAAQQVDGDHVEATGLAPERAGHAVVRAEVLQDARAGAQGAPQADAPAHERSLVEGAGRPGLQHPLLKAEELERERVDREALPHGLDGLEAGVGEVGPE